MKEINDTIKKIILSVLQFDTDIKAGDPKGINKFLNIIDTYETFFSLRVPNKYEEKMQYLNFKKEIQDVFTTLFHNAGDYAFWGRNIYKDGIYKVAESLFIKNGDIKVDGDISLIKSTPLTQKIGKISMELNISVCKFDGPITDMKNFRWEKNPLYNLSDEEYIERLGKKEVGIRVFKEFDSNPFEEFVSKYQGLYDNEKTEPDKKEGLSLQEVALIYVYMGKVIKREEGKIYQHFVRYSDRTTRIGVETTRKKTSNKIERIEKIIPHLSKSAQQTAIDEVNTLKSQLENETF